MHPSPHASYPSRPPRYTSTPTRTSILPSYPLTPHLPPFLPSFPYTRYNPPKNCLERKGKKYHNPSAHSSSTHYIGDLFSEVAREPDHVEVNKEGRRRKTPSPGVSTSPVSAGKPGESARAGPELNTLTYERHTILQWISPPRK